MLIDKQKVGKYTVTIWESSTGYEIRAYLENEIIKTIELPLASDSDEMFDLLAKAKKDIVEWLKSQ